MVPAAAALATACTPTEVVKFLNVVRAKKGLPPLPLPEATPPPPPLPASPPPAPPPAPGATVAVSAEVAVNKLTFGARPGYVAAVKAMGVGAWIDQQLSPAGLPQADDRVPAASYPTLANSNLQNDAVANLPSGSDRIYAEMDHAFLQRAVYSERQLYEVMCDFWANHFNVWRRHTWMGFLRPRDHEDVVRANALGKFSTMLSASAHSPSMLDYLDNLPNDASQPGGVNQNYARELLELHSLGIIAGVQVYTEADVQAVAQIISGWALDWDDASATKYDFKFLPWQHSRTAVTAFGGAINVPARSYGEGYSDGVTLIDYLAHHPSTARYICWKLCRRFIGDNPPMTLVDSAAAVFTANDTAIAPTLRHIFMSDEFAASGGTKVRRPLEHLVACLRAVNATMSTDPVGHSAVALRSALDDMGQPLFERATPDGYPDIAPYWVSSDSLLNRWEVSARIARNTLGDQTVVADRVRVDLPTLLPNPLPATVGELVAALASTLANFTIPAADIADICMAIALSASAAATTLSTSATKLALAMGLILSHPNFQRR